MSLDQGGDSETRFAEYVAGLGSVIGHVERTRPLRDYCTGLMLPGERKSVEPMAARTAPARTAAQHQSLLHFVANAAWSDEDVLAKVREMVLPAIEKSGPVEAWIIDDTSFPKQGKHSVGVHHQYCGQLGKQANCQVAVSLSVANHAASLPVAYRLYLPEAWTKDRVRRKKAGVPKQIKFETKPKIASRLMLEVNDPANCSKVLPDLAGLNAFVFHSTIDRRVAEWDLAPVPPPAARRAGAASLVLWAVIVVAGRMIAYNWFDCDKQPQPRIVNTLAGCVVPAGRH